MRYLGGSIGAVAVYAVFLLLRDFFGLAHSDAFAWVSLAASLGVVIAVVRPWSASTTRSRWYSYLTTAGLLALVLIADLAGALYDACAHGDCL
jgi:hypothetical protein